MFTTSLAAALSEVRAVYAQIRDEVRSESARAQQQAAAQSTRMDSLSQNIIRLTASSSPATPNVPRHESQGSQVHGLHTSASPAPSAPPLGNRGPDFATLVIFPQVLASEVLLLHVRGLLEHTLEGARARRRRTGPASGGHYMLSPVL